jgi:hypothetical protein
MRCQGRHLLLPFHMLLPAASGCLFIACTLQKIPGSMCGLCQHAYVVHADRVQELTLVIIKATTHLLPLHCCRQGRADYHAPFVNLAARMLAAAHGGQVVTSIELAQSIFRCGNSSSSRLRAAASSSEDAVQRPVPCITQ